MPIAIRRQAVTATCLFTLAALLDGAACGVHRRGAPLPHYALATAPAGERPAPEHNTEAYDRITDNPFLAARDNPLSTFSIDVDTASYANVRRFITENRLPPPSASRSWSTTSITRIRRRATPSPCR